MRSVTTGVECDYGVRDAVEFAQSSRCRPANPASSADAGCGCGGWDDSDGPA